MLGADFFALAAGNAVKGSRAALGADFRVIGTCSRIAEDVFRVQTGEDVGNGNMTRTAVGTVAADGAGDGVQGSEEISDLPDGRVLFGGERGEVFHIREIVAHLRVVAHARKNHKDLIVIGGEADGITRDASAVKVGQYLFRVGREIDERPALDRFHDDDRLFVLFRDFIAPTGLHRRVVPVKIVELELNEFYRGIRR